MVVNSNERYDVAVIGAGPAGASAALSLATQGCRVLLLEKEPLPRYKTCGGGVVRRAMRLLPFSVMSAVERDCYIAELNLLDANLHFVARRPYPLISMTMRSTLDFALVQAAQEAGAVIRSACPVLALAQVDGNLELRTTQGCCQAQFVIAADGAPGHIARMLGWLDTRRLIPALECEVHAPEDLLTRYLGSARFDFGVVPYGYGWVFPKRSHLSIGVLGVNRGRIDLNALFKRYLSALGLDAVSDIQRHGFLIPVTPRRPLARDRVLLVGDAAGLADPVTGEGITFAIRSGQLAAQAIVAERFRDVAVYDSYHRQLGPILSELRLGRFLSTLLYGHSRLRACLFRLYGQGLSDAVADILSGDSTYGSTLAQPANYLKLLTRWHHSLARRHK